MARPRADQRYKRRYHHHKPTLWPIGGDHRPGNCCQRVADVDRATFEHTCAQASPTDERLEHGLADELLEVLARRAVLDALEQHLAHAKTLAQQRLEPYSADGQIAAVLGGAQRDAALALQAVQDFGLKQRDLSRAGIGRPRRIEPDPVRIPVATQANPRDRLGLTEQVHRGAGGRRDTDRLNPAQRPLLCYARELRARRSRRRVVVNVAFFRVLGFFVLLRIVVAMRHRGVVVLVRVPGAAVLPLIQRVIRVPMRHVIVIVGMRPGAVGVLRLLALALGELGSPLTRAGLHT